MRQVALAAACVLAALLSGCDRGADSGTSGRPDTTGSAAGSTGKGTQSAAGRPQAGQPGVGLGGGLGTGDRGTAAMGAASGAPGTATQGSKNRTTGSSVGN